MARFWDKLSQSLGTGVSTVGAKSKELLETTKLRSEIAGLQGQRKDLLEELGSIVFATFPQGALDEEKVREKCDAVAVLDNLIAAKAKEVKEVHRKTQEALGRPAAAPPTPSAPAPPAPAPPAPAPPAPAPPAPASGSADSGRPDDAGG